MARTTTTYASVKLPLSLVEQARKEATIFSRSTAAQLEHWAQLGRAIERVPGFTPERAQAAIDGRLDPAELNAQERIRCHDFLDFAMANPSMEEMAEMEVIGNQNGAVGYDDAGHLVRRNSDGSISVIK